MTGKESLISIITPVYNQVDYIEQTILSVINQGYNNLEYIIVDGGSTDGTLAIIKKYEKQITKWVSEPDNGMYDALNKGFEISKGDIMGWINSDDILLPNSLNSLNNIFNNLNNVHWIQGVNSFIDLKGEVIKIKYPSQFSKIKFLYGEYKWIQQESTFWTRNLWEKSGAHINTNFKLAGDFELWFRFFQIEKIYSVNILLGAWRKRKGQLSESQIENYLLEAENCLSNYSLSKKEKTILIKIKKYDFYIKLLKKLKIFNYNLVIKRRKHIMDLPVKKIIYSYEEKKYILK